MKSLSRAVDRFCYKHPGFGIPNLMIFVIIGNVIVYIIDMMDTTGTFLSYLYFNSSLIMQGQLWRLVSFVFIPTHAGMLWFAVALYFYYLIGSTLEKHWGAGKFTIYYLSGVALTMIYSFIVGLFFPGAYIPVDATYLNLSMFFAFAALFPDVRVLLLFVIPIKVKWLALVDAAFFVWEVIRSSFPLNLLPIVAIANFLLFFADDFIRIFKSNRRANSKAAINFRYASRQAKKEAESAPYNHKCSVCGRTDADNPNLEFRYCSRCEGYHCFCIDHINSHVHFTE